MLELGLSTNKKIICEDLFCNYRESGIKAMEISPRSDEYENINYREISRLADKYDITLWSFHLPFAPFTKADISDVHACGETVTWYGELIKAGSDIGIQKFIVHSSGEPIDDSVRGERIKCAKENLAILAEIAKRYNAVIAVEDLPRSCLGRDSAEIAELISLHDDLMVCFDTNHLLYEKPADFIRKLGNRIVTTHILVAFMQRI